MHQMLVIQGKSVEIKVLENIAKVDPPQPCLLLKGRAD